MKKNLIIVIVLLLVLVGCATAKLVPTREEPARQAAASVQEPNATDVPLKVFEDPSEPQVSPTIVSSDYVTKNDFQEYRREIAGRLKKTDRNVAALAKKVGYLDEEMTTLKAALKNADWEVPVRIGNFQTSSAIVTKNMEKQIDKILSTLDGDSTYNIEIAGLASLSGDKISNQALSDKRASNVSKTINEKITGKKIRILRVHGLQPDCYSYIKENNQSVMLFISKAKQ